MDLLADRGRRVSIEELDTSRLLAHARRQAHERNLDDVLIADVDSHHYENECFDEFLPFIENDVLRQLVLAGRAKGRQALTPTQVSFQDMGGRITRYPLRSSEKTQAGKLRDVELGQRWMDAMSVDYSCLFPTLLLSVGLHPSTEMEIELCFAYNRWLTEKVLPEAGGRLYSMLSLPISDPDEALRQVETFGHCKHVTGFLVTSARTLPIHHNSQHEGVSRHRRAWPFARLPLRHQYRRAGVQGVEPLRLGARARISFLQHPAHDQLGHQRARRALSQTAGDLDRGRARLGAVPDAAARSRVHAAHVRISAP